MTFCDQRPGNVTQLDLTYLACYDRFENMKACFWQDISTESSPAFSFSEDEPTARDTQRVNLRVGSPRTFQAKTFPWTPVLSREYVVSKVVM